MTVGLLMLTDCRRMDARDRTERHRCACFIAEFHGFAGLKGWVWALGGAAALTMQARA
jgi:hypothetical protein